jgi:DNA-binding MarR family transcriptional regulator
MDNNELLRIMEQCGHFLYHRRGGKRGQVRILRLLIEHGALTQKELTEMLTLKSGSVSETVGKLEVQGFVTKQRDSEDKRRIVLAITPKGEEYYITCGRERMERNAQLFTALSENEKKQLAILLTTLLEDWEHKFDNSLFGHKGGA